MSQNLNSEPVDAGLMNRQDVDLEEHRSYDRGSDDHMHQREGQQNGGHADVAAPNNSPYLNKLELSLLFIAQGLTASLVLMYVMIIATAIPSITLAFGTVEDIDWYSTAYLFSLCAIQPLMAKAFYLFPLKGVYLASIAIFEIGNIVCGTAPTSAVFIIGRAIAGLGAAGIQSGSLVMLTAAAAPEVRGALMGMGMGLTVIGGAFGPVVGGAITQHLGWRWCMWIFLPPGGVSALVFYFLRVPEQRIKAPIRTTLRTVHHELDIPGFAIFVPAVVMLLLAVSWGGGRFPWRSATIIGLFLGGGVVFGLFVAWTLHRKDKALVPPSVLKKPVIFCGCAVVFLQIGAFATIGDYLPLWFQSVKQATPTDSGLMLLPAMITQIIATVFCGSLLNKLGYIPPWALVGNVLSAVGSGLMTTFTPSSSEGQWVGYQVLIGVGRGFVIQMPAIALQYILSGDEIAIGTAVILFFQYFGSAVFLAISKSIFLNVLDTGLHKYAPSVPFEDIVNAGATDLVNVVPAQYYKGVITAYSNALVATFWLAAAASIIAFFFSFGLGWTRVTEQIAKMYTKDVEPRADTRPTAHTMEPQARSLKT